MQARDKLSSDRPPWESRRVLGRMRARRMLEPAFINALYNIIDACHKDWTVVRFLFSCKNHSYPHHHRSVFRDLRRARSLVRPHGKLTRGGTVHLIKQIPSRSKYPSKRKYGNVSSAASDSYYDTSRFRVEKGVQGF